MNRIDRLTGILLLLQEQPRTAAEIAGRFEVWRRTVMRDVRALCEIGIPICHY
jgi:predicted DNA-binding transcriptional regulator YafY